MWQRSELIKIGEITPQPPIPKPSNGVNGSGFGGIASTALRESLKITNFCGGCSFTISNADHIAESSAVNTDALVGNDSCTFSLSDIAAYPTPTWDFEPSV